MKLHTYGHRQNQLSWLSPLFLILSISSISQGVKDVSRNYLMGGGSPWRDLAHTNRLTLTGVSIKMERSWETWNYSGCNCKASGKGRYQKKARRQLLSFWRSIPPPLLLFKVLCCTHGNIKKGLWLHGGSHHFDFLNPPLLKMFLWGWLNFP